MSVRRNFLDADNSIMENNLRFVKSDLEDNLSQYFAGSSNRSGGNDAVTSAAPPREYKVVQPSPGAPKEEVRNMVNEVSESIGNLIPKKRRSGAQRRKLAKTKRRGIQSKVEEVDKNIFATSIEEAKRMIDDIGERIGKLKDGQIKEETAKNSTRSYSITTIPNQTPLQEGSREHPPNGGDHFNPFSNKLSPSRESYARERVWKETSQSTLKRNLNVEKSMEPPSYPKVSRMQCREDLCYAVIDTSSASGKIPEDQRQKVEDLVNNQILKHVLESEDGPPIEIMNCGFKRGVLVMELASLSCADTLRKLVDGIPSPWNGAQLTLVRKKDIKALTMMSFYIKGWGSKFTSDAVLKIIGKQNAGLVVEKWVVFNREEGQEGTRFVVGIDPDSMASLSKTKSEAFFVSKTIFFKIDKFLTGIFDKTIGSDEEGATKATTTNSNTASSTTKNVYWNTYD